MSLCALRNKILDKSAKLSVIGLGYVGLPVACQFAQVGYDVLGVELREDRVERINLGILPMDGVEPGLEDILSTVIKEDKLRATTNYQELHDCDIVLICVETPVGENHHPQFEALQSALESLGAVMKQGVLIIIESTIAPGTIENYIAPLLSSISKQKLDQGYFLAHCPERVMPGKLLVNLKSVSRVVGGMSLETAETAAVLYRQVVEGDIDTTDCLTAELVKTTENAYRDVQIAFANEVALVCEAVGGNVWKVRELVNKSPGRHMHFPGAGVGGHCIPKDPWLLASSANQKGLDLRIIPVAREINDYMPMHMIELLDDALVKTGLELSKSHILVLGYTYLENTDDTRNSPSAVLIDNLIELGADVTIHDPYLPEYNSDVYQLAKLCDAAVLMVKHHEYTSMDLSEFLSHLRKPILVDGRNINGHVSINVDEFDSYRLLGVSGQGENDAEET